MAASNSTTTANILADFQALAPGNLGTHLDPSLSNLLSIGATNLAYDPAKMRGMGLMDSNKYRAKFYKIATSKRFTPIEIFHIIGAAVAIKNKDRILNSLSTVTSASMAGRVLSFYRNNTQQYVPQTSSNENLFPVVKIPESFPSIAVIWAILIECEKTNKETDAVKNTNFERIMHTLFFPQFNLEDTIAARHKDWERDEFWGTTEDTGKVQKSRYESRPKTVRLQFHEDYYNQKAGDNYVLLAPDGSSYQGWDNTHKITEDEWKTYINYILDNVNVPTA